VAEGTPPTSETAPDTRSPVVDTTVPVLDLDRTAPQAQPAESVTGTGPTFDQVWSSLIGSSSSSPTTATEAAPAKSALTAPSEAPAPSNTPAGGSAFSAPGGGPSTALYALLVVVAAFALLHFGRLQLRPVQWRGAAFVALLERPG
jgi:hypothetical protein